MTNIAGSSIQPWLDFTGDNLPPAIPSCVRTSLIGDDLIESYSSCTDVCSSSADLIQGPGAGEVPDTNNLLTCGLGRQ